MLEAIQPRVLIIESFDHFDQNAESIYKLNCNTITNQNCLDLRSSGYAKNKGKWCLLLFIQSVNNQYKLRAEKSQLTLTFFRSSFPIFI